MSGARPRLGCLILTLVFMSFIPVSYLNPQRGKLERSRREKSPCLVLLSASERTRGKGALAVIWICAVVVFGGFSVVIHLKVRDRALIGVFDWAGLGAQQKTGPSFLYASSSSTSALRPIIFADPGMAKKSANQNPSLLKR